MPARLPLSTASAFGKAGRQAAWGADTANLCAGSADRPAGRPARLNCPAGRLVKLSGPLYFAVHLIAFAVHRMLDRARCGRRGVRVPRLVRAPLQLPCPAASTWQRWHTPSRGGRDQEVRRSHETDEMQSICIGEQRSFCSLVAKSTSRITTGRSCGHAGRGR
ncbi:hypothetical protein SEVIR_3G027301v4 [Setaria viridis]